MGIGLEDYGVQLYIGRNTASERGSQRYANVLFCMLRLSDFHPKPDEEFIICSAVAVPCVITITPSLVDVD
eukprot:13562489-Heterocapsa_arctica.AAC.1